MIVARKEIKRVDVSLFNDRGGYLVSPRIIEFWQGQSNRLHDRIQFRRNQLLEKQSFEANNCWMEGEDGWIYSRLSP